MMTKHNTPIKTVLLFLIVALLLGACDTREPLRIRVTPTLDDTAVAQSSLVPTVVALQPTDTTTVSEPTDTNVPPTDTVVIEPTETALPVTSTVTSTVDPDLSFGPIIAPDYTPPPTSTPAPTQVPTLPPTSTPIPVTQVTTPIVDFPALDTDMLGIQLYYNVNADQWFQVLRRTDPLQVGWIKVQANWEFLQPNGPDDFGTAFSIFESHIQRAHNDGYQVLVSIAKAPDWARGGETAEDGPPADPQLLANFINFMFDRMGEQISALEVWNEPNLPREWRGGLEWSGAGYMQLFDVAYNTVRARYPDMPIITAGLAPTAAPGTIDDREFLTQMYEAGLGSAIYQNVHVGVHPYGWGNPPDARCCDNVEGRGWDDDPRFFFLNTLESYREIMVNYGDDDAQMWATEFGWATWSGLPNEAPDVWMTYNTPQQQAEYTMRAFEIGQQLDYVGPMFLWNLNFANEDLIAQRNEMVGYSILVPGQPIRPIYEALASSPRLPE